MAQEINNRRVLAIAVPIVLSNITVPILGAVDTAVIGQLGKAAPVAAVGVGAIIITAFYWIFGFLRMGTTGLVAQALGARDENEVRAYLLRAIFLGFCAGLVIFLLRKPLIKLKNFSFLISCEIYFFDTGNIKVFVSLYNSVNAPPIPTTNTLPNVLSLRMLKNNSAIGVGSISSIKNVPLLIILEPKDFFIS